MCGRGTALCERALVSGAQRCDLRGVGGHGPRHCDMSLADYTRVQRVAVPRASAAVDGTQDTRQHKRNRPKEIVLRPRPHTSASS